MIILTPSRKKITKLEDFKGLKIRHAGGAVSSERFKALGAAGVVIAWPDVAMALTQGTIDGVATTTKSVESAKLHECGLKYALECRHFVSYYYPMVNLKFWNSLPPDLQKIFLDVWNEVRTQTAGDCRERNNKRPKNSCKAREWNSMNPATKNWPNGASILCLFKTD